MTKDQWIIRHMVNKVQSECVSWANLNGGFDINHEFESHTEILKEYERLEAIELQVQQMSNEQKDAYIKEHGIKLPDIMSGIYCPQSGI